MEYYHLLTLYDGNTHYIPPRAVPTIQRRWDNKLPIHLDSGSFPSAQIKSFEQSDKPFGNQKMIEEVAQAFHEPVTFERDSGYGYTETVISGRWVKQSVTRVKWERHYSAIPGYKHLSDEGNLVVIAFMKPLHEIDQAITPYCTDEEVISLTTKQ